MKKLSVMATCLMLGMGLVLVGSLTADAATVLKYGCVQNIDHPYNLGAKKLAEVVSEKTGGEVTVEIYPDSRLGSNSAMIDQVNAGMLAMGQFPPGTLGTYDKRISILSLYYLFNNFDEMKAALSSAPMKKLADQYLEKTGIRVLGYFGGMERNIITRKTAVKTIDDMKGLKMRAWSWKPAVEWWKMMGAIPAVMSFKEVYTGLQTGVVDGAENELGTFDKSKWAEICKYISLTQHIYTIRPVVINEGKFKQLSSDQQAALTEAMAQAQEYQLDMAKHLNVELKDKIEKKYEITFTEPEKGPFIKVSRELALDYAKEVGAEEIIKQLMK